MFLHRTSVPSAGMGADARCLVQFPLVLIHPRKMRWLFFIKSIVAVIAAFAMLGWAVHTAGGGGPIFSQKAKVTGASKSWAYLAGVNIAISGKTTLAINMVSHDDLGSTLWLMLCSQPDLTRYARNANVTYWQMLFVPIVYWVFSFIGIVIASAGQEIYGTLYWDPTSIIGLWTNRGAAFFTAFAFGLATLGTNISTNSIASSNDFVFIAPKWLNIRRGAAITALLGGWATCPWQIQASAKSLTTFLSGYIIVLAPIVSIIVSCAGFVPYSSADPRSDCRLLGRAPNSPPCPYAVPKRGNVPIHRGDQLASCGDAAHNRAYQPAGTDPRDQRRDRHWQPLLFL